MRNRHFPRLCRSCNAPMACKEDPCWRCGAVWVEGDRTPVPPRVFSGGAVAVPGTPELLISAPPAADPAILIPA